MKHPVLINEVKTKEENNSYNGDYNTETDAYEPLHNNIGNDVGRGQLVLVKKSVKTKEINMNSKFRNVH